MSTFQVETEALVGAATGVKSSIADLDAARQAVAATAGAAAGTPAASAYETLLGDANQQLESLQSAVTELSQALNQGVLELLHLRPGLRERLRRPDAGSMNDVGVRL